MPFLIKRGFAKMQQRQQKAANQYQDKARQEQGKVTVQTKQNKQSNITGSDGEYVDFEEVK